MDRFDEQMETARLNITISTYDLRKLSNWAKCHGKTATAYAAQIVSSRIEADLDLIERMMDDIAAYEGITREELEKRWNSESVE
jgi:hypothetical protein